MSNKPQRTLPFGIENSLIPCFSQRQDSSGKDKILDSSMPLNFLETIKMVLWYVACI